MKVIAECGCNWKTLDDIEQMIHKAKIAGCWAVKFQLFSEEYAKANNLPLYLSLTKKWAATIMFYGEQAHIEVFFTPFDTERVEWCEEIGVNYYKVRYKDRNNEELCKKIIDTNKSYFISRNSFDDLTEFIRIEGKLRIFREKDSQKAIRLWCEPFYPAYRAMYPKPSVYGFMQNFKGYSDHTENLIMLGDFKFFYNTTNEFYWEKHVKLDDDCIESAWSVTFEQLAEVLKP